MLLEFSFPGGGSAVLTFWVNAAMIWSREEAIKSHPHIHTAEDISLGQLLSLEMLCVACQLSRAMAPGHLAKSQPRCCCAGTPFRYNQCLGQ